MCPLHLLEFSFFWVSLQIFWKLLSLHLLNHIGIYVELWYFNVAKTVKKFGNKKVLLNNETGSKKNFLIFWKYWIVWILVSCLASWSGYPSGIHFEVNLSGFALMKYWFCYSFLKVVGGGYLLSLYTEKPLRNDHPAFITMGSPKNTTITGYYCVSNVSVEHIMTSNLHIAIPDVHALGEHPCRPCWPIRANSISGGGWCWPTG